MVMCECCNLNNWNESSSQAKNKKSDLYQFYRMKRCIMHLLKHRIIKGIDSVEFWLS